MTMVNPFLIVFVPLVGVGLLYLIAGGLSWSYGRLSDKKTFRNTGRLLAATSFLPLFIYGALYIFVIWPLIPVGVGLGLLFLGLALTAMAAPIAVVVVAARNEPSEKH